MKKYLVAFALNVLAGTLLYFLLPALQKHLLLAGFTAVSTALTIAILALFSHFHRFRRFGIADLLSSVKEGKGSTKSILMTVRTGFAFMGIAARKWVDTGPILERVVRKIANPNLPVRFLLLDPESQEAVRQSRVLHGNERDVPESIHDSIRKFKALRDNGCSIDIRVYEFLPVFRIALVDDSTAYVGFYHAGMAWGDSPQLVLDHDAEASYFQPYKDYLEMIWNTNSKEVDWSKY